MSDLVLPDGTQYVPRVRRLSTDCPKCGADEGRFKPVLGGQACCMECGHMKETD